MPLCPQITITPITVTSTGMSTNNVIPNVFVNTEELDSVASSVAGKTKTYRQASAPTGTDINDGDLWFDTDDGNKLYMRVSGAWVSVQDLAIAAAQTTADGKNKIFRSATPPTATAIGDTWFDTANGNKLYFWNGTAWIDVQDDAISAAQATADSKVKTFYQASAPTASEVGDIWFDTDDGFKQYFWNGSVWTSVQDTAIAAATTASAAATAAAAAAQTTANGKNKVVRSTLAASGTSGYTAGDIWWQMSSTSLDSTILAQWTYDGTAWRSNTLTNAVIANLDAGKISTGFLAAARIEAASLNADKLVAGSITATQIATGTITASQIAASTITGSKIAAGTLTADNIAANTIVASKIAAGTITATQIAFATITGDQIAVETITALEIAAESITVDRLSAGTLTAFTLQTSTGTRRVTISAANNAISFREAGSVVGWVGPASISGIVMHYGATFTPGVTAYPNAYVSDGDARIAFSSTKYVQVSTTGVVMSGDVYSLTNFYNQDTTTTANAANTWMSATNGLTRRSTASSLRYKDNVVDLRTIADIDPKKLLNVPVRAFSYKTDYLDAADDRAGLMLPGFIAEEMAEIYPIAADKVDGVIESWNDRFVVPGMLALIQDLYARVEILENK